MRRTLYHYARKFRGDVREGFLLRLKEGGQESWGEIAPLPGFSKESLEEAFEDFKEKRYALPSVQFGYHSALADLKKPISCPSTPICAKAKVDQLHLEKHPPKRIDFNRTWKLEDALALAERFSSTEYFEEPLALGEAAENFPYPVALDESLREGKIPPYPNVVAHVIKPTLSGFPLPLQQKGVDFILSSSYESELGIHQIAKLQKRLGLPERAMGLATYHLFEEPLFEEEPYIEENVLYFPSRWSLKKEKVSVALDEHI